MAGKKTGKRLLTWVLVLVMALSLLPLNVLAGENDVSENPVPEGTELAEGDTYTLDTDDASKLPKAPEGLRWDGPESIKGDQIICGKNEHQHDSDCYQWEWFLIFYRKLVCNQEEHIHSDYCYNHTYKWTLVKEGDITTSNTWRRWWPVYWTLSKSGRIDANDAIESVTAGKNVAYTNSALDSAEALAGTTATLGDAVDAGGFTITTKPGYYVKAARVICGNYNRCGVSNNLVPTGQTEGNYSNTIDIRFDQGNNDLNFDHLSANGNDVNLSKDYPTSRPTGNDYHNVLWVGSTKNTLYPYYFLIQVAQDPTTYSVSYDWGDQELSNSVPKGETNLKRNESYEVSKPSKEALAEAAEKNLAFAGWKYNNSNMTYQVGESFSVSEDVRLTAQWTQLYTVSYELDGGSWKDGEAVENANYPENVSVSVTNNEPEKSGYEFIDWTPSTDNNNVDTPVISKGKFTMPAADVTLTAQWTARTDLSYTVNYYWNGEQIQAPTTGDNAMHGDKITITDTSIDGYTLIPGQQTSMTIGTGENVLDLNYYKNVTLTANSDTKTYDGTEHTVTGYTAKDNENKAVEGLTFKDVTPPSASGTDAGTYLVKFAENAKDKVSDNNLYIVTKTVDGKLTINKRIVTLTSETASKPYDGTPLTRPTVTVGGDGFVEGEVTDIRATGSVTYVSEGEVTNTITFTKGQKFKDSNYDITKDEGTLTITEASAPTPGTFDFDDVVYGDGKVTPAITKTVKGNVGRNFKETFKVTVEPKSDNAKNTMTPDYYTGKAEVIASKSLKDVPFLFKPEVMANAVVPYGELRFTEAGTYTYTVREVPGGTSRMSYDTTEYTLTIKVVLNENANTYQVESWQFTAGNSKYPTPLNIVNTYRTYHPSAPSKPTLNTGDHYAYVMGYPDGTVRPNGSITRAEVSTILFRLLSDKTRDEYFTTESSFTDVKAGAWYNNSIATLEKAGVIVDTAKGGAFRPNEAITRAELAAMLAQFSDAKPVKGVKFSDVSAEHWAYEAIAIAAKMGWIEGYPDGTFRPDATITRAEMMTLVNRALDRVPSDEDHLLSKRVMLTFPDCKSGDWFYIAVQEATNSHTYERAATEKNGDEQWTALRANRDWTLLEK